MASSSSPPPTAPGPASPTSLHPAQPSPLSPTTTISPPTSTTTSTTATTHNRTATSTVSPPISSTPSSLSSPQYPLPHHVPPSTTTTTSSLPPHAHLPSPQTARQISEARTALVASIGNMLDASLRDRASVLHSNAAAIAKQERDVAKATEGLRKENDKLAKVAGDAARKVKELGHVQNWAEVLERDFLVLEDTLRRVREGSSGSEGSWSGSGSGSWSGSEDGDGDARMEDAEDRGEGEDGSRLGKKIDKGKGKETDPGPVLDTRMDVDGPEPSSSGQTAQAGSGSGEVIMPRLPDMGLPPVRNTTREAPSIKVPGLEPSQESAISLEDELRSAMDETIGILA